MLSLHCEAAIYKCETSGGIVFSQIPCAEDALVIDAKSSRKTPDRKKKMGPRASVDIEKFKGLPFGAKEIIEQVGEPVVIYIYQGDEHWLYPNALRIDPDGRFCPEILLRGGERFQMSWFTEDVMKKAVTAALSFKGWRPNDNVGMKTFYVSDTDVVGDSKDDVLIHLGPPDEKKISMGTEVWEYYKVRYHRNNSRQLSVILEFDGDIVSSSLEN